MKRIIILGSTGSIGTQTLEVIRAHPDEFQVIGLSAHDNVELFKKQTREFQPKYEVLTSRPSHSEAKQLMPRRYVGATLSENPTQALQTLATVPDADIIVNALAGTSGLLPTFAACKAGKKIALANKESLVMAGELIMNLVEKTDAQILPIDSEISAIWQMGSHEQEKIILTASGGPFWKWRRKDLEKVTFEQALQHPTWKMGEKVSIDSATLMNKAFEIIETRWLFDMPPKKIEVTIHRQSIVHALVQFCDGNTHAVLSFPNMRIPISYALFYPERAKCTPSHLDFSNLQLTFEKPDYSIFEGPKLAYEVLQAGGIMPAALCLADEIAVTKFRNGEISFLGIYDFIKRALERVTNMPLSMEALMELPNFIQ